MSKKALTVLIMLSVLFSVCPFSVHAEEVLPEETPATSSEYEIFVEKVTAVANAGYPQDISFTSDSVYNKGITLEPYTDILKFESGFVIKPDLPFGIEIYDDPNTDIVDGIRVNGKEVTSYTVPIDLDNPQSYLVEVRTVYAEGFAGTVAKISAGEFNWETLMGEPLLAMQIIYYAIAILSLIIGGLGVASSKKKKVKTADDIAAKVDSRVKEGYESLINNYTEILTNNLSPILQNMVQTNQAVVKAITLSTSKNKEAPVALLDLLKNVSDVDVEKAINAAREDVLKNIADTEAHRKAVHKVLTNIADGTYQEVQNVEQAKPVSLGVTTPTDTEEKEAKSIF